MPQNQSFDVPPELRQLAEENVSAPVSSIFSSSKASRKR